MFNISSNRSQYLEITLLYFYSILTSSISHSLLDEGDCGTWLGNLGVVSLKPGNGATLFMSCSMTAVSMFVLKVSSRLMPRALWKLWTALARSPVRDWT